MKTLIVLLLLASGFGLAALWQSWHVGELQARQRSAWEVSDGEVAETESGTIREGWATVVIGAPSGVAPLELAVDDRTAPPPPADEPVDDAHLEAPPLGDFELEVRPGQTLSGIAHAHYGTAPAELVQALAEYNGLADANALRSGASLRLPELSVLVGGDE